MAWVDFKKRIRSVNAKITVAERIYGKDSKLLKSVYKSLENAYGTAEGGKRRFTAPPTGWALKDIAKIDRALQRIEISPFFSKAGRESMGVKARETWKERNADTDVRAYDFFIKAKQELGGLIYATSAQIIETLDQSDYMPTKKEFDKIVNDYKNDLENNVFIQRGEDNPQFFEYLYDKIKLMENEKLEKRGKGKFYGL